MHFAIEGLIYSTVDNVLGKKLWLVMIKREILLPSTAFKTYRTRLSEFFMANLMAGRL